jgi:hypothetical protein
LAAKAEKKGKKEKGREEKEKGNYSKRGEKGK